MSESLVVVAVLLTAGSGVPGLFFSRTSLAGQRLAPSLLATEDDQAPIREAGWIYLVATHTATLCLFALFALLRKATGSYTWAPLLEGSTTPGLETAIFLLALVGFGLKAGIMPLHVWL